MRTEEDDLARIRHANQATYGFLNGYRRTHVRIPRSDLNGHAECVLNKTKGCPLGEYGRHVRSIDALRAETYSGPHRALECGREALSRAAGPSPCFRATCEEMKQSMYAGDVEVLGTREGLHTFEAEFVTEHLVVCGEVCGPDGRLSDHLNGSAPSVEIRPHSVKRASTGGNIDLGGAHAVITKAHLLFVVPISEPRRPSNGENSNWTWTTAKRCWAALGRHGLGGNIHAEAGRDSRLILRALEQRQFLPFTEVTITHPDGAASSHGTVIINRAHVEMLALRDG